MRGGRGHDAGKVLSDLDRFYANEPHREMPLAFRYDLAGRGDQLISQYFIVV